MNHKDDMKKYMEGRMIDEVVPKPKTAERWMTVINGKVAGWADGHPAHELLPNQVSLTPDEMSMLRVCDGDLSKAEDILRSLRHKIKKAVGAK